MKYDLYYMADSYPSLTTKGKYYLLIPSRSIRFDGKIYEKELTITVPFDPTMDIQYATTSTVDNRVRVYNAQGILIRVGESRKVLEGLKGLYIVNGRKISIK